MTHCKVTCLARSLDFRDFTSASRSLILALDSWSSSATRVGETSCLHGPPYETYPFFCSAATSSTSSDFSSLRLSISARICRS